MRLLFASRSIPRHHWGGMEMVAWELAAALTRLGHDITFLTTRLPAGSPALEDGVRIETVEAPAGRYSSAWWRKSASAAYEHHLAGIDLVMGIGSGAHGILDEFRRKDIKTPIVIQSHGTPWGEIRSKIAVPSLRSWAGVLKNAHVYTRDQRLARYSRIIPIGPAVEESLASPPMRWLTGSTPRTVIENGVAEENFTFNPAARERVREQLHIANGERVILVASRLLLQKGVGQAIDGFAKASGIKPNMHLLIAGAGPDEMKLRAVAKASGVTHRIHFIGPVRRQQMSHYLSAADVYLFPSLRQEGLALAPLEAAANGLPTILAQHIALPELAASLVEPRDITSIAQAIVTAAAEPADDRQSRLPNRYTLMHAARRYESLFGNLIQRSLA